MSMRRVAINDLPEDVRSFLSQVREGEGIMVEDETGRAWAGVVPYDEAPVADQEAALKRLEGLQKKVGKMMKETGRTEEEFDRLLQDKS
jgi:hypothetical protein